LRGLNAADLVMLGRRHFFSYPGVTLEKVTKMETKLYVGNLSKSTTQDELKALFTQAGDVITADIIKDRKSGESRGFAFVTMSAQSEADKAVSMFNASLLGEQILKVDLANPRQTRGVDGPSLAS
jgi:RNA recognition motif-containing protein